MTIGCKERGDPSKVTFSHATGEGWVQAKEGHYDDAIHTKRNSVNVMIFDDLGGTTPGTAKTIKGLSPKTHRGKAPAMPQTTAKPIRNASTNTTPPPYHSHACKALPCRS